VGYVYSLLHFLWVTPGTSQDLSQNPLLNADLLYGAPTFLPLLYSRQI